MSTRSRSSTSCLKVGLWEGTACQHSRMIMYLRAALRWALPCARTPCQSPSLGNSLEAGPPPARGRGSVGAQRGPEVTGGCARSQIVRAVGRLVHAVAFLQQLEELLHGDAGVRRAPQREDLPEQDTEGPAVGGGGAAPSAHPAARGPPCMGKPQDRPQWGAGGYRWWPALPHSSPAPALVWPVPRPAPHPTPARVWGPHTRHSGECRRGQTRPRAPSTSRAGGPGRRNGAC